MKSFSRLAILLLLAFLLAMPVHAHPGKTDSNGGHWDYSTGEYHYHHGYTEHQHWDMNDDGILDCPYNFENKTNENNSASSENNATNNIYMDSQPDNYENSKSQKEKNHFVSFVIEVLKEFGIIAIGYALFGLMFLKIKIEETLDHRRFKKGKKKNHTLPWVLVSLLFVSISVSTVVCFLVNDPQVNPSAISTTNLMDTIFQILLIGILTIPVILFVLLIIIVIIVGMLDRMPENEAPHSAFLKAAAVNATIATAIIGLLILSSPLLQ